ncbi:L,D-transpeptidase family protein [Comamonas serinivorans]|uniref:L,D-transpeptidase family protein n=1 Tax=Comamonas serinivorans TaxID=1082851 RepID=UPI0012F78376|nr:L,D-transpeptidase family protein [Comamonas serinivorans]
MATLLMVGGAGLAERASAQPRKETTRPPVQAGKPDGASGPTKVARAPRPADRQAAAQGGPASTRFAAASPAKTGAVGWPSDAEARLLAVIRLVENQQLNAALLAVASLTHDVPNFQAAQLVYADLLRFKAGKVGDAPARSGGMRVSYHPAPKAAQGKETQEWQTRLHALRDELVRRVHGANGLPEPGRMPSEFLAMPSTVRHAIAVDASKSRLYLFTQEGGTLRLTGDFYVSIGKLGMGKLEEGDQRTPQGVYFVGRQIEGARLPHLYGKGALTLNYPNDWDRAAGRGGSGIWLHGAPPEQFARVPQASDGCIVLSNPDLLLLMGTVDPQTPVLVRERLHWVAADDAKRRQAAQAFQPVLAAWQQGWSGADPQARARLYSDELAASPAQQAPQRRLAALFRHGDAAVEDVSVFAWKDAQGEIRIVNLKVTARAASALTLRQYWRKTGDRWQLFSEDILS